MLSHLKSLVGVEVQVLLRCHSLTGPRTHLVDRFGIEQRTSQDDVRNRAEFIGGLFIAPGEILDVLPVDYEVTDELGDPVDGAILTADLIIPGDWI